MFMASEKKRLIIELQQYIKLLMFHAGEYEIEEREISIVSALDQSRALSHIITIMACEENMFEATPEELERNFKQAFLYLYRAFWGAAKWLCDDICEKALSIMEPFSVSCIEKVISDYYETIRPELDRLRQDINKEYERTDISEDQEKINKVGAFWERIEKLCEYYDTISQKEMSLQDVQKKQKKHKASNKRFKIFGIILAAILTFILTFVAGRLSTRYNSAQKPKESPVKTAREAQKEILDTNETEEAKNLMEAQRLQQKDPQ